MFCLFIVSYLLFGKPPEKRLSATVFEYISSHQEIMADILDVEERLNAIGLTSSTNKPASLHCGCLSSFQQWNTELPQAVIQVLMLSRGQARVCSVCNT